MIFQKGVEVIIAKSSEFFGKSSPRGTNPPKKIGSLWNIERNPQTRLFLGVSWSENAFNSYVHDDLIIVSSEEMNQFETPEQFYCHMKAKVDRLCDHFQLPTNDHEFTGEDHFDVYFHFEKQLLKCQEIMRTSLGE